MLSTAVLDAVRAHTGPWSWRDLEGLPEGYRYEIDDGALVMAPSPGHGHNRAANLLWRLLDDACPSGLVAVSTGSVQIGDSYREPDVAVVRRPARAHVGPVRAADVPLAAEVVSPTSGERDRETKLTDYAHAGIAHYWIVELDPEPTLVAYALRGGAYVEVATVRGDQTYEATEPFPVSVTPNALLR